MGAHLSTPDVSAKMSELGKIGAQKSAEVRAAKAQMRAEDRAQLKLAQSAEALAGSLLDAVFGRGNFGPRSVQVEMSDGSTKEIVYEGLDDKERLAALKLALEWGIGRPKQVQAAPTPEPEEPTMGIRFAVGEA